MDEMIEVLRMLLASLLGTMGFAVLIHAPKESILPASLVGAASYLVYWLMTYFGISEPTAMLVSAVLGSVIAQVLARRMHMIATVFNLLAIVPLVPGLGLFRFMEMLGSGQTSQGAEVGVAAMTSIAMLALGIGVGSFLSRAMNDTARRRAAAKANRTQQG